MLSLESPVALAPILLYPGEGQLVTLVVRGFWGPPVDGIAARGGPPWPSSFKVALDTIQTNAVPFVALSTLPNLVALKPVLRVFDRFSHDILLLPIHLDSFRRCKRRGCGGKKRLLSRS